MRRRRRAAAVPHRRKVVRHNGQVVGGGGGCYGWWARGRRRGELLRRLLKAGAFRTPSRLSSPHLLFPETPPLPLLFRRLGRPAGRIRRAPPPSWRLKRRLRLWPLIRGGGGGALWQPLAISRLALVLARLGC